MQSTVAKRIEGGAEGGIRTLTGLLPTDFKSGNPKATGDKNCDYLSKELRLNYVDIECTLHRR